MGRGRLHALSLALLSVSIGHSSVAVLLPVGLKAKGQ